MAATDSPSYAVLNREGKLVAGYNPQERQDPASTTKAMTLVTLDQLADEGKISRNFIQSHQNDVVLMMRDSNNAAAHRLATAAGADMKGGESTFIAEMNRVAQEEGIINSRFVTPDGMPAQGHYSTAEDMAKIMHLLRTEHENVLPYASQITTASGIIGTKGIDYAKTGTAQGLYGSTGKSSMVFIKDGYSAAVAGAHGPDARRELVQEIASAIPTTGEGAVGITQLASVSNGTGGRSDQASPDSLHSLSHNEDGGLGKLLGMLLMALVSRQPLAPSQSFTAGENVTPLATPVVANAERSFSLSGA